jgi:hypothetical protein
MGQVNNETQKLKMKFKLNIFIVALLLLAVSCSRKVALQKSHTKQQQDSSHVAIDTSSKTTLNQSTRTTKFGDTLKANLFVAKSIDSTNPATPFVIESNGLKIKGTLQPVNNNLGFLLNLNAIAKPTEVTENSITTTTEKKGIAQQTTTQKNTEAEQKSKAVESVNELPKWVSITIMVIAILLVIALHFYLSQSERQQQQQNAR